ncbi:MAG: 6-hydroxymethylpterin diphosphokinase MptE-like protein [Suilimivivens sp.]
MSVLLDNIRRQHLIRAIILPIHRIIRRYELYNYHKRVDLDYFNNLRESQKGARCFIVGNGPSLKATDLDLLKNEITFAFNKIFDIYSDTSWRPTFYMVTDKSLINTFLMKSIPDIGSSMAYVFDKRLCEYWSKKMPVKEIFLFGKTPVKRETLYIDKVSENVENYFSPSQSVSVNAIELAFYMGFSEIYLLGFDHEFPIEISMDGKKIVKRNVVSHFSEIKDKQAYPSCKEALTLCFETCKKYADEHGVKIYNATRGGKLEVFERIDFDSMFGWR